VIVDLHCHYPMHLLAGEHDAVRAMMHRKRSSLGDQFRAAVLNLANRIDNYPGRGDKPAVTVGTLAASNVRVALSVLYGPLSEIDIDVEYGAPPQPHYFHELVAQIASVEAAVAARPADAMVAHNHAELAVARAANKVALIHAIEGGFAIGDTEQAIRGNVAILAAKGVAYITVAHLFYRQVATNAPALPFLTDSLYTLLFPQPRAGLTKYGQALIEAMVANRILIDVTHMSTRSLADTLQLLDQLDPQGDVPILATHAACRVFSGAKYNLSDEHIAAIARRRGVIGLIACEHWMARGMDKPKTFADTMQVLFRHIDQIHRLTREPVGVHSFTAFGSDHDGFIKPALPGLDRPGGFVAVEQALADHYGAAVAEQICSANALRVLDYWKGN
jgi:membrane dipeptidase